MNFDRKSKKKKRLAWTAVAAAAVSLGILSLIYLSFRLGTVRQEKKAILKDFRAMERELTAISAELENKNRELQVLHEKIDQLRYPQRLKQALSAAQSMVNTLNSELTNVKTQADILRGENFALKSRVAANTKELDRLVQELNQARTKIATLESSQNTAVQEERLTQLNEQMKEKDRLIRSLNRDIGQLKNNYNDVLKERDFLSKNIERYQKELTGQRPSDIWQKRLEELAGLLKEKDREKEEILTKYTQLSQDRDEVAVAIEEYKRNIEELKAINQTLQDQVIKLTADLGKKNSELYVLKKRIEESPTGSGNADEVTILEQSLRVQKERIKTVNSLYNRLRDQLKDLSGLLYKKDAALDEKDRQLSEMKDKMASLKIKADNLQEAFTNSEENQKQIAERLSQATNLNATLQERLSEVSTILGEESPNTGIGLPEESSVPSTGSTDVSESKDSTEDLRRKVEVILESIEGGDQVFE